MKTKKLKERAPSIQTRPPAKRARSNVWPWVIGIGLALFAAFQVYAPAMHAPFLFDDLSLPMNVPAWQDGSFMDSLRGVRPLLMASYWLNSHPAPADTVPYHTWNVLIHSLNALLVFF